MRHVPLRLALIASGLATALVGNAGGGVSGAATSGVVLAANGGRIVAANADGSGLRVLTHPSDLQEPDWDPVASPDGSLIAFTRAGEPFHVAVMRSDGSRLRLVAVGADPSWSPDGSLIAYNGGAIVGQAGLYELERGIWVARADGSNVRRIMREEDYGWSWSPHSDAIAFASDAGISVADIRTGVTQVVLAAPDTQNPAFSPDGSQIAFDKAEVGVRILEVGSRRVRALGPPKAWDPVWSPDGRRLVVGVGNGTAIAVVDVLSGRVTARLPGFAAAWSPDGDRLVYLRSPTNEQWADEGDVWVARSDGSQAVRVTRSLPYGTSESPPVWLPGVAAVAPDPPIPTVVLHPTAVRQLTAAGYELLAVDGTRVAIVYRYASSEKKALGVWRGRGAIAWLPVEDPPDAVALSENRVYWSYADSKESTTSLWTATWPGGKPVRLLDHAPPFAQVAGDRTLVVYTYGHELWRLQGTTAHMVRRERGDILPLSVDSGRVLLKSAHGRLEVINGNGKLLASIRPQPDLVGACLSGSRVVVVTESRIKVYRLPAGTLRATWPVGAAGVASPSAWVLGGGRLFASHSLIAYQATVPFHLLGIATGHDHIITVDGGVSPTTVALTKTGLFYTEIPEYSAVEGRVGFVPLSRLQPVVH